MNSLVVMRRSRFLVTCRVLSYQPPEQGKPDLRLSELPSFEIAPFDEEKIGRFVEAWYAELARLGTVKTEDQKGLTARLAEAVARPDLKRLAPKRVSKSWVNEVFDMSLVVWESLFVELSAIKGKHK